ncbi:MAG: hypothetical protein M1821_006300 [Bathelium mastoideum]|nr:MAG: hypothetical protein M1821_006300 [Bathelium mastoideum]
MAPGLNYGQQCYEGLKAFRGPEDKQISIFRPDQNALRMQHSAEYISIPPVPIDLFQRCVNLAVSLNAAFVPPHRTGAAMYVRPLLFGSSAQLGLDPPEEYLFCVYVMPTGVYHGVHPVDALILEDFDRAAPEGTGSAKVGGNYAPVLRWSDKAKKAGFNITLHMDSKTRTEVDEFSTSGFIGVHKQEGTPEGEGYTLVVPDSKNVIKSVTSDTACELAKSFGWKVEKRQILYKELPSFSEVMAAGTAAALVPIKSITMRSTGDKFTYQGGSSEPGPVCLKLLSTLKGIQQGKIGDKFGWLDTVREAKEGSYAIRGKGLDVTRGDVDCIKNDWLTDNVIAFWEEWLERERLRNYPKANIVLLRPSMSFMLRQTKDPLSLKEALPDFSETTHIFLPINDARDVTIAEGGSHWSLLVVSAIDGVAFHYDSLHPTNRQEAQISTEKLSILLGRPLQFRALADSPQQENGSDCGVFVCLQMQFLLVHKLLTARATDTISMSLAGKEIDATNGRKQMLQIIEGYRKEGERRRSRSSSPFNIKDKSKSPPRIGDEK